MAAKQAGWDSYFEEFTPHVEKKTIVQKLEDFVSTRSDEVSKSQIDAWNNSVKQLQVEIDVVINKKKVSKKYDVILEYELPYDYRRPDGILLLNNSVVVLEFKGGPIPTLAAVDQTHDYARDLSGYHRECQNRTVQPVLVNMSMKVSQVPSRGVNICSPSDLGSLILELDKGDNSKRTLTREKFLSEDVYCPLPSLIKAAREIFHKDKKSVLWHSIVNTDNATNEIKKIVMSAIDNAKKGEKSKHLVLVTGVPGAGKTLVGLRVVHNSNLEKHTSIKSTVPSIFLSGNDPLVRVLQYELKSRTFVKMINKYKDHYHKYENKPLNEHVIVFDEAQRAWDKEIIEFRNKKKTTPVISNATEPDSLIEFAERKREDNDWTVLIGLIGDGQEIQIGEESGIDLWVNALNKYSDWTVHASEHLENNFKLITKKNKFVTNNNLHLAKSIRSHKSNVLHKYVRHLLDFSKSENELKNLVDIIEKKFIFYVSRDPSKCRSYLQERYESEPDKRFGKIASSRAIKLNKYGFNNEYMALQALKNVLGPWYANGKDQEVSCCNLCECVTEFEIQGLELDATFLCWGSDFIKMNNRWCIDNMKQYNKDNKDLVKDPDRLRKNAYRVLLTRARDACLIYVPFIDIKDEKDVLAETYKYLKACGMKEL